VSASTTPEAAREREPDGEGRGEDWLERWLEETRRWAEACLERYLPPVEAHPARLTAAMRYALFGGGKRLRPALVRLVAEELGGRSVDAERAACAIECVHTYSLVHDDLPCMDDDDLRRGRATCHVAFDEATAVLAGDGLLTFAFQLTGQEGGALGARLTAALARGAGANGMVGGQVLDLAGAPTAIQSTASEPGTDDAEDDARRGALLAHVRDTHLRKTAMLFGAAAELGALVAGAAEEPVAAAREYGLALGLAFQAQDDLLDVTGDAATLGKTPGKDAALERATLVGLLGLEGARLEADRLAACAVEAAERLGWGPRSRPRRFVRRMVERNA